MFKIQSKVIIVILFFGFLSFLSLHQSFAQQCTGTSSSACGTQQIASCIWDQSIAGSSPYYYCQSSWGSSLSGYACNAAYPGNTYTCEACVPTPESCSLGGSCITYQTSTNGQTATITSCTQCAVQSDPPTAPGGCQQGTNGYNYNACTSGCTTYCTSGSTNCGTCSGGSLTTNYCGNTTSGTSQTCQYDAPQTCTNANFTNSGCTEFIGGSNCSTNYTCPITSGSSTQCTTNITGHAYIDYNHDGQQDNGEPNLQGVAMVDGTGSPTLYTDTNGNATDYNTAFKSGVKVYITMYVNNPYNGTTYKNANQTQSITLSNSNGGSTLNFGFIPEYTISGNIYTDFNHDGTQNNGEPNYTASTIQVTDGTNIVSTDANGNFSFTKDEVNGTYTISIVTSSIPAGYKGVTSSESITINGADVTNATLSITPLYQISGLIFNDIDLSHCYNPSTFGCTYQGYSNPPGSDTLFTNGSHLKITGTTTGTISTTADASNGVYQTSQTLPSGTYTVTYDTGTTPLPSGYRFIGPYTWQVVVGDPAGIPVCNTGSSPDAKCGNPNNGSIANLNFGVSNENTWSQPICSDTRYNSGYSQPIPSTASCGGTSAPYAIFCSNSASGAILFSGNTNPNYGQGTGASSSNYQVGNFSFPESYNYQIPNTSATSYNFVNTSLNTYTGATTPLKNICPDLTHCVLSEATAGGVYTTTSADGPVSLSISNVDGTYQLGKANYVFLIGGNITFTTNLLTQNGYSTTFISGQDIHVAGNVGESSWTSTTPDLEGFFSANNNFDIDAAYPVGQQCTSSGQPKENKLNIVGSVITNAGGTGGTVVNSREGCLQDLSCPAITVTSNPEMILNASGVLKPPYTFWQEQNP